MGLAVAANLFYRLFQMLDALFSMVIGIRYFLDYPASSIQHLYVY